MVVIQLSYLKSDKFQDSWFSKIYEKFRNERKGMKEDPEVMLKKKKKNETTSPIPSGLRRGAVNWIPPYPEGEDEASLKRHKEFIQNEWSRRHPDMNRISRRMQLTFPDRRRLMNNKADIKDVRAEYPALFDYQQVMIKNLSINK